MNDPTKPRDLNEKEGGEIMYTGEDESFELSILVSGKADRDSERCWLDNDQDLFDLLELKDI